MRDSTETRIKLMRASMIEFSEKGYARTRLQDIAKREGLTAALLIYHYGSKKKLAVEVVRKLQSALKVPQPVDLDGITSDSQWRAALRMFISSVIELLMSKSEPNCFLAGLYRHEAAYPVEKDVSLHDNCLLPIFHALESIVALGVPNRDPVQVRCWSLVVWNTLLGYCLKQPDRVQRYLPEGETIETFHSTVVDFVVDEMMGKLKFKRASRGA